MSQLPGIRMRILGFDFNHIPYSSGRGLKLNIHVCTTIHICKAGQAYQAFVADGPFCVVDLPGSADL